MSVVLPQRLLERLAQAGPSEPSALGQVEGLRRWRIEAFGEALLDAAAS